MNQRILELAIDAGIVSAEYNGFDPTGLTKAQRKFAELIVRECMELGDKALQDGKWPGDVIEKHFGVGE